MKCYVHIGTEKTGTTVIQEFLHVNRKSLKKHQYLFTQTAGQRNNVKLPLAAYDKKRRDVHTRRLGLFTDEALTNYQKEIVQKLKKRLEPCSPNHTVIFSSEHIHSRLRTEEELIRLKSVLNEIGFKEIYIIVYLRSPVDIATSLHSTAVKFGNSDLNPPPPGNEYYKNACDHKSTLLRYGGVFGQQSIIPRLYSKQAFKNGNILEDFMDCLNLDASIHDFEIPGAQNKKLSQMGIEILRRVNKKVPLFNADNKPNNIRNSLVQYFESNFSYGADYSLPVPLYREYESAFRESNEWVKTNFFPEREQLFPDKSKHHSADLQISDDELDSIADLIADIWIGKTKELHSIKSSQAYRFAKSLNHFKKRLTKLS